MSCQRIAHDIIPQNNTATKQYPYVFQLRQSFFREFFVEEYIEWTLKDK